MFGPKVQVEDAGVALMAEFWDCHRLDPKPVADLRKHLEKYVGGGGKPVLIADLSGVGFAGSAALGGFVGMRKLGVRVIFYNVEPTVLEVFAVTQLGRFFQFAADRESALALVEARPSRSADDLPGLAGRVVASPHPPSRPTTGGAPPLRRVRRSPD